MKRFFKLLVVLMMLSMSQQLCAQDDNSGELDFGVDLMSRYVWRGFDFGAMPSIQPGLAYTKGGFEIGVWGAYAMNFAGYQETDLYVSYTFLKDMLSIGFTDYYFPDITALDQGYFDWGDETGHCVELNASFNGLEKFPLSVSVNTFLYGADKIFADSSLNTTSGGYDYNTKANYSTYVELGYSFGVKEVDVDVFAGFQVNGVNIEDAILDGGEGFYLDGPGLINLGLTAAKEIEVTDKWSLPVSSSFIVNPKRQRVYFVFGFTF
jgi:hypothetical protein